MNRDEAIANAIKAGRNIAAKRKLKYEATRTTYDDKYERAEIQSIQWYGDEYEYGEMYLHIEDYISLSISVMNASARIVIEETILEYGSHDYGLLEAKINDYEHGGAELITDLVNEWYSVTKNVMHLESKARTFSKMLLEMLPSAPRGKSDDDPGFWTDGDLIFCPSESEANTVADFLEDVMSEYTDAVVTTGIATDDQSQELHYVDWQIRICS